MNAEEIDRHLISYHEGGDDYRYCFSKQEADAIKNSLNDIKFGGGTKEALACANATLDCIKKEVKKLRSGGVA